MKVTKKVISDLNKCYSIAPITVEGKPCFLVAAEKKDPCYLFSEDGEKLETVWTEPGGVMTMVQVPGVDGQFLATHKFYSPNDSLEAKIVIVTRRGKDDWEVRTLCNAPFVHRFGILNRGGTNYLIVCCLKTGHEYKNDWRFPGACFGAELPKDLSSYNEDNTLPLTLIMEGMLKNHGYSLTKHGGHDAALVGCEEGSFLFDPPAVKGGDWEVTQILDIPTSDSVLCDFDGDGKPELGVISPFHGNSLTIYHLDEHGNYVPQWKYGVPEKETEMLHATWADTILGKPSWIVGWRKGTKNTIIITWDAEAGDYRTEFIDQNTGCANAMHFVNSKGQDVVIGTNREIDEAALYILEE
ncbi:MAG: hypothetical protein VZR05_01405 [Lachnospiraceae bacterium]|jgi:hypothetical protein|nr:hypothetical protein [Lachnospiraceae bacterium]